MNYNTAILNELKEYDLTTDDVNDFYIEEITLYAEKDELKTYDFDIVIEVEDFEINISILIDATNMDKAREIALDALNETL